MTAHEEAPATPVVDAIDMSAWATVKLALTGKELDFTSGPIGRAIVLLAIPMVLEMVMESVFALTDAFFVSRLGTDAVATVGLTEAMISILFAVAFGTGMATTAMVARRFGEGDVRGAGVAAAQSIVLGVVLTLAVAVPGVVFAGQLLSLMGGSPELVASGRGYTQGGAGAYPLSEPETKAVFDFLMRRTHISVVNSLDTTVPMILRGPSTSKSEESVFPEDLEYLKKFDQKGMEITGYPWAGDTYFTYANRGRGGAPPSPNAQGSPLFGHGPPRLGRGGGQERHVRMPRRKQPGQRCGGHRLPDRHRVEPERRLGALPRRHGAEPLADPAPILAAPKHLPQDARRQTQQEGAQTGAVHPRHTRSDSSACRRHSANPHDVAAPAWTDGSSVRTSRAARSNAPGCPRRFRTSASAARMPSWRAGERRTSSAVAANFSGVALCWRNSGTIAASATKFGSPTNATRMRQRASQDVRVPTRYVISMGVSRMAASSVTVPDTASRKSAARITSCVRLWITWVGTPACAAAASAAAAAGNDGSVADAHRQLQDRRVLARPVI